MAAPMQLKLKTRRRKVSKKKVVRSLNWSSNSSPINHRLVTLFDQRGESLKTYLMEKGEARGPTEFLDSPLFEALRPSGTSGEI
jgi:hypothetical protein